MSNWQRSALNRWLSGLVLDQVPFSAKALVPRGHVAAVQRVQVTAAAAQSVLSATVPGSCARVFFQPAQVSSGGVGV